MVTCHFSSKERTKVVIVNRAFVREKSESFGRSGHLQHIIQLYNRDIFTYNLDHVICFADWTEALAKLPQLRLFQACMGVKIK